MREERDVEKKVDALADVSQQIKEKVEDFCREHPWSAMAMGVGIGVGIGMSPLSPWLPRIALAGSQAFFTKDPQALSALKFGSLADAVWTAASKLMQDKVGSITGQESTVRANAVA